MKHIKNPVRQQRCLLQSLADYSIEADQEHADDRDALVDRCTLVWPTVCTVHTVGQTNTQCIVVMHIVI
jgi:hypothetical protein